MADSTEAVEAGDTSQEITFKTITQQTFKYTFPSTTIIGDVKKRIFEDKGEDFEVDRQKLIYNGKVLEDTQTLADIAVDEKKYIVVMVSRKKTEQPVVAPQQSTSSTTAPASSTAVPATNAAPSTTTTSVSTPIVQQPQPTNTVPAEHEETVNMICGMGYPRDQVITALRAAFFNADRAVEYLCTGIPNVADQNAEEGAVAAELDPAMEGEGDEEEGDQLAFLRDSPQFAQLCQLVRSQPEMLPSVLAQIAQSNPELMQVIRDNQEAFVQMLNEGANLDQSMGEDVPEAGGQPSHQAGHLTIAVTENDRMAIQRLQSMGFPEQLVIEAYFACDKNEDLAVNYILSRLDEVANESD